VPLIDGPDCRLWVELVGEGEPVTIFAHGITSSSVEISPFAWHTKGTRVLFDFRGHGRSETPPETVDWDTPGMRRDLEFVADSYGATRALGVSMGSSALLHLLADEPGRFERLVFFIPSRLDSNTPASKDNYPMMASLLESLPLDECADRLLAAPESQPLFNARPAWRELMRARILRMNAVGVPRALRAFAEGRPPVADPTVLERVTAPTLILAHENDPIHPADTARRIAGVMPNAELRIWDQPLAMLDDFGSFAETIGGFLTPEEAA
jgi:pimeloyl-ACP methyl ester carboxylesterase